MTFRLGVLIGLACGLLLASLLSKRQPRTPAQPVDSDRDLLDYAGEAS